jgi:hypothetical protein
MDKRISFAVRALLRVEWAAEENYLVDDGDGHFDEMTDAACPCCRKRMSVTWTHKSSCDLDAALRDAGFVTNADREKARKELGCAHG